MAFSPSSELPPGGDTPRPILARGLPRTPAVVAIVAGLLGLLWCNPARSGLFPPCPWHWLTGLYCPGCGSLRALHYLLHGDLAAAVGMNPLLIMSLPAIGALILRPALASRVWVARAALVLLVAYGILRNIPAWPFCLLGPH